MNILNNQSDYKNNTTGSGFPVISQYNFLDKPAKEMETLLVVDDEKGIVELCKLYLEDLGYTVLTAIRPDDAIRIVESYNKKIDMLITDIIMPVMNGPELAERISSIKPEIKCVFISGYPTETISDSLMLNINKNLIKKPFRLKDFAEKIRNMLDS